MASERLELGKALIRASEKPPKKAKAKTEEKPNDGSSKSTGEATA